MINVSIAEIIGVELVELTLRLHNLLQLEVAYNMLGISVIEFPYPRKVHDRKIELSDPKVTLSLQKVKNSQHF